MEIEQTSMRDGRVRVRLTLDKGEVESLGRVLKHPDIDQAFFGAEGQDWHRAIVGVLRGVLKRGFRKPATGG